MAFDTSVSGIRAANTALGVIGNNIANAGTTGFKLSRAEFADVFTTSLLGTIGEATGKGVTVSGITQSFKQGNISFTENVTDMAISGGGFFVLNDNGAHTYSRAGNFQVDREGYLVNSSGHQLMAFRATASGAITQELVPLRIDTALVQPSRTTAVTVQANLDSREAAPATAWPAAGFNAFANPPTAPEPDMYNASTSLTIYDSLGNPHVQSVYFVKGANQNEWEAYTLIDGVSVSGPDPIAFGAGGQLEQTPLPLVDIANWTPLDRTGNPSGADVQDLRLNLSSLTQFGNEFSVNGLLQDGHTTGELRGIEVGDNGVVYARFTNYQSKALGQVALAKFSNVAGLQPIGNTSWTETYASGQPTIGAPGSSGLGVVQSGALEESNVEVTQQLVDMIVAQRNFQANAKMIQTEDTITQTVINLR